MLEGEDLRRAIAQQLASLRAAGVVSLPRSPLTSSAGSDTESDLAHPPPDTAQPTSDVPQPERIPTMTSPPTSGSLFDDGEESVTAVSSAPSLTVLQSEVVACTECPELVANRTQTVFGVGNPTARLCFFGEAPGADEDRQGEPFVGRAGQMLTRIIENVLQMRRDDVYILNVLKCRPPGNRNPTDEEAANCRRFYERQLELISPEFICCLGAVAAHNLLGVTTPIGRMRGRMHRWRDVQVVCTYHPAYLLRNPAAKKYTWDDILMLADAMGLPT